MPMQIRRTPTPDLAPTGLAEGQLGVEMASAPPKLWVGVPTTIDPSGRRQIAPQTITSIGATAPAAPSVGNLWFDTVAEQTNVWDGTQWLPTTAPREEVEQALSNTYGRNFIDNAFFSVQQRGVGPWTTAGYGIDRWNTGFLGGTVSVQPRALPAVEITQIGDAAAQFCYQNNFTGGAAATNYCLVWQPIEGVRRLLNQTVTVSFWAASPTSLTLGVSLDLNFGTGGSATQRLPGVAQPLTTTWTRYDLTFIIPGIGANTIGTAADYVALNFWYSAGTNFAAQSAIGVQSGNIRLWGVQVELGDTATPLERPNPERDLARCMRFYQALKQFNDIAYAVTADSQILRSASFPVPMRATPTILNLAASGLNQNAGGFTGQADSVGLTWSWWNTQMTGVNMVQGSFTYAFSAEF